MPWAPNIKQLLNNHLDNLNFICIKTIFRFIVVNSTQHISYPYQSCRFKKKIIDNCSNQGRGH